MISIIVPIYNVEQYLERCVDSILAQTFTDIEVILINDGSPDNCLDICNRYAKLDKRVVVIDKPNGGLSDARNSGLDICKGEWVSFVDSDDWISPDYCEVLMKNAVDFSADISICDFEIAHDGNSKIENGDISCKTITDRKEKQMHMRISVWAKLYKSTLFDDIRFPFGKLHEDNYVTYKLYDKAENICSSNHKIYYYFVRQDSIINSEYSRKRLDAIESFEEEINYFEQQKRIDIADLARFALLVCLYDIVKKVKKSGWEDRKQIILNCKLRIKELANTIIVNNTAGKKQLLFCKMTRFPYAIASKIVDIYKAIKK